MKKVWEVSSWPWQPACSFTFCWADEYASIYPFRTLRAKDSQLGVQDFKLAAGGGLKRGTFVQFQLPQLMFNVFRLWEFLKALKAAKYTSNGGTISQRSEEAAAWCIKVLLFIGLSAGVWTLTCSVSTWRVRENNLILFDGDQRSNLISSAPSSLRREWFLTCFSC